VTRTTRTILTLLSVAAIGSAGPAAEAAPAPIPGWVTPAVAYLSGAGYMDRSGFDADSPMRRRTFKALMVRAFGGGYHRVRGYVKAHEVSGALVRALGQGPVARHLNSASSPDGWHPDVPRHFGGEVVAREMGLRHDRPASEERFEASSNEPMTQADIAWAVWQAKTSPDLWAAEQLAGFSIPGYGDVRRKVISYALSLTGKPYVWGGEWADDTPAGYPYGSQSHGGFDCSGFVWYVLRKKATGWDPPGRPYAGWRLPERTSAQMAGGAAKRLAFDKLRPADVVFFAGSGTKARPGDVYHEGIYLGHGWMVHSSGSRDGISISYIGPGTWWYSQIAWGRRVIH
jgi:cell wall-associated NlpC family hydrolase